MKLSSIIKTTIAVLFFSSAVINGHAAQKRVKPKKAVVTSPTVNKGEIKRYSDMLSTRIFSIRKGESSLSVEYPVAGAPEVVSALREQICKWITGKSSPSYSQLSSPEQLLKNQIREYKSKGDYMMEGEIRTDTITISYFNNKVVTVNNKEYEYGGGAHGTGSNMSMTFLLSNGNQLTYRMLPGIDILRPYIYRGLIEYYQRPENGGYSPSDEFPISPLTEQELEFPNYESNSQPFINELGLSFTYGMYEVTAGAYGCPTASIPLETVRPLCSGAVLEFF